MATYPDEAYKQVMDYYSKLPEPLKEKANSVLTDFAGRYQQGEAPPDEMLGSLKALANGGGGLESKVSGTSKKYKLNSMVAPIALSAAALMLMYVGLPPIY